MKQVVRQLFRLLAELPAAAAVLAYLLGGALLGKQKAFESTCEWLAAWPGASGAAVRNAFLRHTAASCDPTAIVSVGTLLSKPEVEIGRHVYIGPRCHLGWVTLEDDVLLGPAVQITSGPLTHRFDRLDQPIRNQPGVSQQVTVGRGAWIGAGAIIMADVGSGAVVGAGSIVTRTIPPNVVAAGAPARVIRHRDKNTDQAIPSADRSPPLHATEPSQAT